jgi:hypothetical protein
MARRLGQGGGLMIEHTDEEMAQARRRMIQALAVLTAAPMHTPSLAARNVIYRTEELMKALDDFWAGRDPDE